MSFTELLEPAGHGPYLLASFGISFVVLAWNVVSALLRDRALRQEIRNEIRARRAAR